MELGESGAQQDVLGDGEDAVARELVERHAAFERAEPRVIMRLPKTASACPSASGRDEPGQLLRRVLPVSVHHRNEIEAIADSERVADLLVASVPLVVLVPQDRHQDFGVSFLVAPSDL